MKKVIYMLGIAILASSCAGKTAIDRLRTEYQTEPMGIEVQDPRLSWQMKADRYGAAQTAYRVVSAATEENLRKGEYLWDSGEISSDKSVGIPYLGELAPCTRYYWKVLVRDENGKWTESGATWFETGLMGESWEGAQWIGSNEVILNPYRIDFIIDYDVTLLGQSAGFVYSAIDENNFFEAGLSKDGRFSLTKVSGGESSVVFDVPVVLGKGDRHHVRLDVYSNRGEKITLHAEVDGRKVVNPKAGDRSASRGLLADEWLPQAPADIYAFPVPIDDKTVHESPRLYNIGYRQAEGQKAEFTNISISERQWNTTFFTDTEVHAAEGGEMKTWSPQNASAPMLRKEFEVGKGLQRARLYASARGIYEVELNGAKVGEDYYNPGWPSFEQRNFYNSFDVTSGLKEGANALGVTLGAGWWNDAVGMSVDPYGTAQSFVAKLVLEYADGSRSVVVSDGSWKVYDQGPVTANGMQTGEDYDARKEVPLWSSAGFDDSGWTGAKVFETPSGVLQAYVGETVKCSEVLEAVAMTEPEPGVYIYDMGQNMVGIPSISGLKGAEGQTITMRYAEMLWPEVIPETPIAPYTKEQYEQMKGRMYVDNYRVALSEDRYTFGSDGAEVTFEPSFTEHGYRYIEITGLDAPLPLKNVKGMVLNSIGEQLSYYETSNELTNRLFSNIVWGEKGNFVSIPTDCPQRDERMGWTGDAQVFSRTATYNMMTDGFYNRWMYSMRDTQGENGSYPDTAPAFGKGGNSMGWMEAGIIVPFQVWQQYGDLRILEDSYESMSRYMDFLETRATGYIQKEGFYGDWLGIAVTNTRLTNTAYYAYDAILMEKMARALGKNEDAAKYARLYDNIKQAWNEAFVDEEGYTKAISDGLETAQAYVTGVPAPAMPEDLSKPYRVNTQTSYAVPLQARLFNDNELAVKRLVESVEDNDYILNTGFIGTPYLCLSLSEGGRDDVAYKLFEQTEYPSWLFPVLQGATTMWERWNSYTIKSGFGPVSMNSFNHYSYGAIEEWMMSHSLGIQRDEQNPGYKHILLQPKFGGEFSYIKGGFESIYGQIDALWEKKGNTYIYSVTIPANTSASILLPSGAKITKGQDYAVQNPATGLTDLPAGSYRIVFE